MTIILTAKLKGYISKCFLEITGYRQKCVKFEAAFWLFTFLKWFSSFCQSLHSPPFLSHVYNPAWERWGWHALHSPPVSVTQGHPGHIENFHVIMSNSSGFTANDQVLHW